MARSGYHAVFAEAAVEFLDGLSRRERRKVLDRVRELAADPFLVPDFRSTDARGREIGHIIADKCIFDVWVDHAEKQVVISGIDHVE